MIKVTPLGRCEALNFVLDGAALKREIEVYTLKFESFALDRRKIGDVSLNILRLYGQRFTAILMLQIIQEVDELIIAMYLVLHHLKHFLASFDILFGALYLQGKVETLFEVDYAVFELLVCFGSHGGRWLLNHWER